MKIAVAFAALAAVLPAIDASHHHHHHRLHGGRNMAESGKNFNPKVMSQPMMPMVEPGMSPEEMDRLIEEDAMSPEEMSNMGWEDKDGKVWEDDFPLNDVLTTMYDCVEEVKFVCYDESMRDGGDDYGMWGGDYEDDHYGYDPLNSDLSDEEWDAFWDVWNEDDAEAMWDDAVVPDDYYSPLESDAQKYTSKSSDGGWRKLTNKGFGGLQKETREQDATLQGAVSATVEDLKKRFAGARGARHEGDEGRPPLGGPLAGQPFGEMKAEMDRLIEENGELTKAEMREKLKEIFRAENEMPRADREQHEHKGSPGSERPVHKGGPGGERPEHPDGERPGHRGDGDARTLQNDALRPTSALEDPVVAARKEVRTIVQGMISQGVSKDELRQKIEEHMASKPQFKDLVLSQLRKGGGGGGMKRGDKLAGPAGLGGGLKNFRKGGKAGERTDMDRPARPAERFGGKPPRKPPAPDMSPEEKGTVSNHGVDPEHREHDHEHEREHKRTEKDIPDHDGTGRKLLRHNGMKHHGKGRMPRGGRKLGSNCPNGDLDWLVQNVSPQCAAALFALDDSPMFLEDGPWMFAEPWMVEPDFHHQKHDRHGDRGHQGGFFGGGGKHGWGGQPPRFGGKHGWGGQPPPPPPPPHGCGMMLFGVFTVGVVSIFCIRRCRKMRRNRRQIIQGRIVQDGGGAPIVPTGVVVNFAHGQQPQVVTGQVAGQAGNGGAPMFYGYPANVQPAVSGGAPSSSAPTHASAPTNGDVPIMQQANGKALVSAPTNGGAPIMLSF